MDSPPSSRAQQDLIALLQRAHAGELAAARAYRGHAASWWARRERAEIEAIEADEWRHRAEVGEMLQQLGGRPQAAREALLWSIGSSIGLLCHLGGWLIPMFGAGLLERANFEEYEHAARLAREAGMPQLAEPLLAMAETEWDHEAWFRARVVEHPMGRRLPLWQQLPARESIRSRYQALAN
ncbi:MAG: hypothetical protein CVV27_11035 [Candidatus Melainabacteria bacterium HGW-Melainabacteria-1]|nr:MAG: hypothetical protein CVV27_11035 [Candidatus Melainabacteria bacterium HGW-Melainabacteria-1]